MSNSISFCGRVANDGEVRQAGSTDVLNFRVASDVGYGDRKVTNWFNIQVWGKRANSLLPHIEKGKQLFITGELTLREYDDRQGQKRTSADVNANTVEFISTKGGGGGQSDGGGAGGGQQEDMPF